MWSLPKSVTPLNTHGGIKGGWEDRGQSKGPSRFQKAPSVMFSINSLLPDRSHPSIRKEFRNLSSASRCSKQPQASPCHAVYGKPLESAACQSEWSDAVWALGITSLSSHNHPGRYANPLYR